MGPTMVAHGRPSRHVLSAGGSSTGPNGAWQCVAEEVHVHRRVFPGQDCTAHVGLPSEPERLYGRWQEQRLRYHELMLWTGFESPHYRAGVGRWLCASRLAPGNADSAGTTRSRGGA